MVRIALAEDYKQIESIMNHINKDSYGLNSFIKYIVYDDNSIKGFLIYEQIYERIEIDYLYVISEYRRQKVASKLLEYLINYCKIHNITNITLEVNENNLIARSLYSKFGFTIISTRKNYYKDNDGILMIRTFDSNE